MQNNISIFKHEKFVEIRVITKSGEPQFIAKDICASLGIGNVCDALKGLDDDEKGIATIDTPGGTQDVLIVSEAGLYSLILRSRKPEAKAFKRWVTHEVLPSIRKHGGYLVSKPDDTPDTIIARALLLAGKKIEGLEAKIAQDAPKVKLADDFLIPSLEVEDSFDNCISVGVLAKKLKQEGLPFGQNRLFKYLRKQGVLCSRDGENFNTPTQEYMERGWFKVKATRMILAGGVKWEKTTMVTPKGVKEISARIHELFNQEVFA